MTVAVILRDQRDESHLMLETSTVKFLGNGRWTLETPVKFRPRKPMREPEVVIGATTPTAEIGTAPFKLSTRILARFEVRPLKAFEEFVISADEPIRLEEV